MNESRRIYYTLESKLFEAYSLRAWGNIFIRIKVSMFAEEFLNNIYAFWLENCSESVHSPMKRNTVVRDVVFMPYLMLHA